MSRAAEIVRAFYAAVSRADVPTVVGLLHPDLHWTEAEGFPYYGGTWRTPQEVVDKLLVPLARDWDGFSATPEHFVVEANEVVAFGRYAGTSRLTGRRFTAKFAHLWTVRDGKLARFDMYTDTLLVHRAME